MEDTAKAPSATSVDEGEHDKLDPDAWNLDAEHQALLNSFDGRLAEAHRGMDRILARLNVE